MTDLNAALAAARHIFTWTTGNELRWLGDQASRRRNVVELGSYMGHTAMLFAHACPGPVYCVDHFETDGVEHTFRYFLREPLASGKVNLLKGESCHITPYIRAQLSGKVDMLFIDAGHRYADVYADITAWLPLLSPRALLCGHDWHPGNEVARAVAELIPKASTPIDSIWAWELP